MGRDLFLVSTEQSQGRVPPVHALTVQLCSGSLTFVHQGGQGAGNSLKAYEKSMCGMGTTFLVTDSRGEEAPSYQEAWVLVENQRAEGLARAVAATGVEWEIRGAQGSELTVWRRETGTETALAPI